MGGEKYAVACWADLPQGSPPHGRGKEVDNGRLTALERITPAWAGKSKPVQGYCKTRGDHPRMGGEKLCGASLAKVHQGSPPHGRGKVESGPEV